MLSLAKMSLQRNIGSFIVVLGILVGGTWVALKATTDYLLYEDATTSARDWATFLANSVTDLEQIAAGEQPSAASMAVFEAMRRYNDVFRYVIFNRDGYSQLVSDRHRIAMVELSERSSEAVQSARTGRPVVDARKGQSPDFPLYYSTAYLPVRVGTKPIAIIGVYVDQTDEHDAFYRAFLVAASALCLLTGLAFSVPAIAWYRRTREKQQADRRIRYLAHHDTLTGLANRAYLIEMLNKALATLPLHADCLAVHFIDLDRFKEVNDTLGHDGGDFLLKTVAERLLAIARIEDIVARLGGDEFVVVQRGHITKDSALAFANRAAGALAAPIHFREHEIVTTASIGVAMAPADGSDPDRLLKSADLALYKAKEDGRNCVRLFLPEMDAALVARLTLEKTVRDAVLHDRFVLHFQPVFEVSNQKLTGFEALLRISAPDGELIPPAAFIPIAEDIRLIDKIGAWVLREACRTAMNWPAQLTVAVNLSPAQFDAGNVSDVVAAALAETGLEPHRLELEITETLLLANSETILKELTKLKSMGVAIVMDDFGTGYSSLSYLWRFPFNKIKIDRSFMQDFDRSEHNAETLVKTMIALGRELHMQVTVEGVETARQAAFLDHADADQVQGFFFGRPMPADEIAARLLTDFQKSLPQPPRARAEPAGLRLATQGAVR